MAKQTMKAMDHPDKLKVLYFRQTCAKLNIEGWPREIFAAVAKAMGWTYNNRRPPKKPPS
jgi:hypothetical protein